VRQHRGDLVPRPDPSFDPLRDVRVQPGSLGFRDALVGHLAGDGVLERVLPFSFQRGSGAPADEVPVFEHPEIGEIESLSGDHDAAAEQFGLWYDLMIQRGTTAGAETYSAWQGRELCLAGRYAEAEQHAVPTREHPPSDTDEPIRQQVAALVSAHRGDHAAAERFAREALASFQKTDSPKFQGDTYCDLAEVLEAAGRRDEAIAAWNEALDRYEGKGIVPLVRRVRERLAALDPV